MQICELWREINLSISICSTHLNVVLAFGGKDTTRFLFWSLTCSRSKAIGVVHSLGEDLAKLLDTHPCCTSRWGLRTPGLDFSYI